MPPKEIPRTKVGKAALSGPRGQGRRGRKNGVEVIIGRKIGQYRLEESADRIVFLSRPRSRHHPGLSFESWKSCRNRITPGASTISSSAPVDRPATCAQIKERRPSDQKLSFRILCPGKLLKWHPGIGVVLRGDTAGNTLSEGLFGSRGRNNSQCQQAASRRVEYSLAARYAFSFHERPGLSGVGTSRVGHGLPDRIDPPWAMAAPRNFPADLGDR